MPLWVSLDKGEYLKPEQRYFLATGFSFILLSVSEEKYQLLSCVESWNLPRRILIISTKYSFGERRAIVY